MEKSFGSDNFSAILPEVQQALTDASSSGHEHSYGEDRYTRQAVEDFKKIFGNDVEVYFVYNGTGANVLSIGAFTDSYNAVICAETAHINVDECGAVEKQTGCKLLTLPTLDGKLTVDLIRRHLHGFGNQHHVQPKVISITQCTEMGTVYTSEEIRQIADLAHANGMYLHVDGARIANAVAFLDVEPSALIRDTGVDVLSFGGTKNGMLFGEAVIFFTRPRKEAQYLRKQLMQLHSKGRFIAAQFSAVLTDNLWLRSAAHANRMACLLASKAADAGVKITQPVQANEVFAIIPKHCIEQLQNKSFFYVWNEDISEVRWVCSFDTTEKDVNEFVELLIRNC